MPFLAPGYLLNTENLYLDLRKFILLKILGKRKFLYFCRPLARVAELVDALDSKSSFFGSAGSIPASSTFKTSN